MQRSATIGSRCQAEIMGMKQTVENLILQSNLFIFFYFVFLFTSNGNVCLSLCTAPVTVSVQQGLLVGKRLERKAALLARARAEQAGAGSVRVF